MYGATPTSLENAYCLEFYRTLRMHLLVWGGENIKRQYYECMRDSRFYPNSGDLAEEPWNKKEGISIEYVAPQYLKKNEAFIAKEDTVITWKWDPRKEEKLPTSLEFLFCPFKIVDGRCMLQRTGWYKVMLWP